MPHTTTPTLAELATTINTLWTGLPANIRNVEAGFLRTELELASLIASGTVTGVSADGITTLQQTAAYLQMRHDDGTVVPRMALATITDPEPAGESVIYTHRATAKRFALVHVGRGRPVMAKAGDRVENADGAEVELSPVAATIIPVPDDQPTYIVCRFIDEDDDVNDEDAYVKAHEFTGLVWVAIN
jgi:hypothetical protein